MSTLADRAEEREEREGREERAEERAGAVPPGPSRSPTATARAARCP